VEVAIDDDAVGSNGEEAINAPSRMAQAFWKGKSASNCGKCIVESRSYGFKEDAFLRR